MLFVVSFLLFLSESTNADSVDKILMPGAEPVLPDSYLCTAVELDDATEHYLTSFKPYASMQKAHHMLLFGCREPGSYQKIWDCGQMTSAGLNFVRAQPCRGKQNIIYAWGRDAPPLVLPEGVGFKVGGNTEVKYLVLQVHYMKKLGPDNSGVAVESTTEPLDKTAAVLLMVTGGVLPPLTKETFEAACNVDEDVELHPIAFRTHTHRHGIKVDSWVVKKLPDGNDYWQLLGERNPLLPQLFQAVNDSSVIIRTGDTIASRCIMENKENKAFIMGNTGDDEMCNVYLMYWVYGDNILKDNVCYSAGAPDYRWKKTSLNNLPT